MSVPSLVVLGSRGDTRLRVKMISDMQRNKVWGGYQNSIENTVGRYYNIRREKHRTERTDPGLLERYTGKTLMDF